MPIIKPSEAWTEADSLRAAADGWKLEPVMCKDKHNRDRVRWLITAFGETKTDEEAIQQVVNGAGKGYPQFLKALILHGTGIDIHTVYVPTGLMS